MHILNALRYKNILSEEYEARQGGARRDKKDLKIKKKNEQDERREIREFICAFEVFSL